VLPALLKLNKYGHYLHTISTIIPPDHSAIQVVVGMIDNVLSNAADPLDSLKPHVARLQDFICLTTGMGLVELWTKWKSSNAISCSDFDVYSHGDFRETLNNPAIKPGRSPSL